MAGTKRIVVEVKIYAIALLRGIYAKKARAATAKAPKEPMATVASLLAGGAEALAEAAEEAADEADEAAPEAELARDEVMEPMLLVALL